MRRSLVEPLGLTFLLLVLFKLGQSFLPSSWTALLIPLLLLYTPFLILSWRRRPIDFVDRSWPQFFLGLTAFWLAVLIVFPPYTLLAHFWMLKVFDFQTFQPAPWQELFKTAGYQLLVVAIPEEFYFRGFLQSALTGFWKPRWRILGARLGWGWIITALIFAFAHSVIRLQWWHFSIFFPALLFGYLKERTNSITAPILFHAFSNCFMNWFSQSYL